MDALDEKDPIEASITAGLRTTEAHVRLMRFNWASEFELRMTPKDCFWLDQCITPRPSGIKGSFPEHTGDHNLFPLGDLIAIPPGETLRVRADLDSMEGPQGSQESIVCCLDRSAIEKWNEGELGWEGWTTEALDIRNQSLRGLLWRLIREVSEPGLAGEASVEMICGLIAIDLSRHCAKIDFTPAKGGLASWRLRLIDEILDQSRKPPSLSELATACNISVRQLIRGFSVSRGVTLGNYIESTRLVRAQRLLSQGAKVKIVAHTLGFASPASFCGAFKRRTGVSPGEYRRRV